MESYLSREEPEEATTMMLGWLDSSLEERRVNYLGTGKQRRANGRARDVETIIL